MEALTTDLMIAKDYANYFENRLQINLLMSGESNTFAAGWAVTLARSDELGLNKRSSTDWNGGFQYLFDEQIGLSVALVDFALSPGLGMGRTFNITDANGEYQGYLTDTIITEDLTHIVGTNVGDVLDIRSGRLSSQIGYTVDGHFNDDIAVGGDDFDGLTTSAVFAASALRTSVLVAISNDGVTEARENFLANLTNAPKMRIVGGAAIATIVDSNAAAPTLLVGNSYAWEGDGYATFRLSLSKATTEAITVALTLADGKGLGTGVDYGASGTGNIQVSLDGINWTDATSATFAAGSIELFVRTAVVADNVANPEYVQGGSAPEFLHVEGNERFTLTATVTAGASALANGAQTVSGTGTIVDGAGAEPLVWIDDVIIDEASGQARFVISRSRTMATSTTVGFATSDRRALDIDIAATVDGGDGNDTIYASNLGDNLFGGAGNDTLYGGRLDDWLLGGDGDDILDAGTADAMALGGDGNYLNGGAGNDILRYREGSTGSRVATVSTRSPAARAMTSSPAEPATAIA